MKQQARSKQENVTFQNKALSVVIAMRTANVTAHFHTAILHEKLINLLDSKEILGLLLNPKIHDHVHNSPRSSPSSLYPESAKSIPHHISLVSI